MNSTDRRERPWKKIRVIVEVTVPPTNSATERDLIYHVMEHMPRTVAMRRPIHDDAYDATIRVKGFTAFWPMFLRMERGLTNFRRKPK